MEEIPLFLTKLLASKKWERTILVSPFSFSLFTNQHLVSCSQKPANRSSHGGWSKAGEEPGLALSAHRPRPDPSGESLILRSSSGRHPHSPYILPQNHTIHFSSYLKNYFLIKLTIVKNWSNYQWNRY